jgi:protein-tyrosine-phosphatase
MPRVSIPSPVLSRRIVIAAAVALAAPDLAQAACAPPAVLFVCPYGTVKSAIARETLKQRAAQAGLAVTVRSRGVAVQDHVSPQLAAKLKADGLDPAREAARKLDVDDLTPGQIVIAFDEAAQDPRLAGARVWDIPSWNESYDAAKAALSAHMTALLAELEARRQSSACS